MNEETIALYRAKTAGMSRAELNELAAVALYHLQVVVGSRNSFETPCSHARPPVLEQMHLEAADFSIANQV